MSYKINKNIERGRGDFGWLKTQHSFSFGQYFNPDKTGFESLRVINEDVISPQAGFPAHAHQYMEILTLVLSGNLTHRDSMNNEATLIPGKLQRMYAGAEVRHSEYNASKDEELHLLQIWITPSEFPAKPEYEEKEIEIIKNTENVLASGHENSGIKIHQQVEVVLVDLETNNSLNIDVKKSMYLHVISGSISIDNQGLNYGDSFELTEASLVEVSTSTEAKLLAFKFY